MAANDLHIMESAVDDPDAWEESTAWNAESARARVRRPWPHRVASLPRRDRFGRAQGRSRRELPAHAVSILKAWLVSDEHFHHPYPTQQDQAHLMVRALWSGRRAKRAHRS